jgi:multisubunit Na+/H+ antiporter MnhG subunit
MIVGLHNFVDAFGRYKEEVFSSDGGLSIVMMDGLLLIPVVMAAFFYPVVALELLLGMIALSVIGMVLMRAHHRGRLHLPRRRTKV